MGANAKFETVLATFKDYICKEVLATDIVVSDLNDAEEIDINGSVFGISLEVV